MVRIARPRGDSQSRSHRVPSVQGTSPILLAPSSSAETADRGKSRRKGSGTKAGFPRVASLHRNCGHDSRWPVWSTPLSALCKVTSVAEGPGVTALSPFPLPGWPGRVPRQWISMPAVAWRPDGWQGTCRRPLWTKAGRLAGCSMRAQPGHARQTTHSWRAVINTKVNCVRAQVRV